MNRNYALNKNCTWPYHQDYAYPMTCPSCQCSADRIPAVSRQIESIKIRTLQFFAVTFNRIAKAFVRPETHKTINEKLEALRSSVLRPETHESIGEKLEKLRSSALLLLLVVLIFSI